ncbi:hypothetical protein Ccrd_019218 [Cynara cardunculus var. scolymus]|uniref:Uncharacterized protein n=1 Tax=Cynara cardunculus var. scolymus TaxID=59895 RepID=A0A103Y4W9_CYNCS|nr:hypothetical protein Ccrd_019218 [Cynara cardunculus var. scolymus]
MPGMVTENPTSNPNSGALTNEVYVPHKELFGYSSPRSPLSTHSPESDSMDLGVDSPGGVDTSIEQLYHNVCEMQSSDQSPSRFSYLSYGQESRIDSELRFLAGGDFTRIDNGVTEEPMVMADEKEFKESSDNPVIVKPNQSSSPKVRTPSPKIKPPSGKKIGSRGTPKKHEKVLPNGNEDAAYVGTYLLKQARDLLSSGDNVKKAFDLAQRALKSFESSQSEKPNLEFVMCLHIVAALNCSLGRYNEAIPLLERSIEIPSMDEGQKHSLAKFAGCMQLASLEEAADRRLMGLICDSMGDYETALEHYVLASMAMAAGGHETDVAAIDVCIGDAYLSMVRYDEAVFSYQKALNLFKSTKGENHPSCASVFVRLADLYNKIGKFRESKSYCENALRIYVKPVPGFPKEEIASGLVEVSSIYESMNELDQALNLLKKALKAYGKAAGQLSTVAGIEAQIGVLYYMMGSYKQSYDCLKTAISKLRAVGEKKSALFGVALNQMGLAWNDAIEILEYVVGMREEKLGTANPDVDDEKRRLTELLDEAGRNRNKKSLSLEFLLEA